MNEDFYSADYRQARKAFLTAAAEAGLDSITRVHPSASGPDGKPLFLDTVSLGPREAQAALLLICGSHGVEGYFGSAVLCGLLRERAFAPPPGAKIVLLHALNPFGFAWNLRGDEKNVDIDGNFVDFPVRKESAAAGRAQYTDPAAPFYGGKAPSWSRRMLADILGEELRSAGRLIALDLHTGPGVFGAVKIVNPTPPDSEDYRAAERIWGRIEPGPGGLCNALIACRKAVAASLHIGALDEETYGELMRRPPDEADGSALRRAFLPDDDAWRRKSRAGAQNAVAAALTALSGQNCPATAG